MLDLTPERDAVLDRTGHVSGKPKPSVPAARRFTNVLFAIPTLTVIQEGDRNEQSR